MTNFTERVKQSLGKHFVTLSCVQNLSKNSSKTHVFCGFVVDIAGEWFFVTAGHILRDISAAIEGGSSLDKWRLDDQTANNRFNGAAVPYDFNLDSWLIIRDDTNGLDYAAVHLGSYYESQLKAGGVIAIAKNAWSDHLTDYDYWVLVGVPAESILYDGISVITARIVLAPLVAAVEPDLAGNKAQNQFYAKPIDGSEDYFKDASGMSGVPVFALKKIQGEWKYSVIGIQSAWYPSTKTLAICPFSTFGFSIEKLMAELKTYK